MKKISTMVGALVLSSALSNAAPVIHDFSGDNLDATSTLPTGVASSVLSLGNPGQLDINYSNNFTHASLSDGLVVTRLATGGHPFGNLASNGLAGETGRTLGGDFAAVFKYTVTADSGYDLVLNSFTFSKTALAGGTALRSAFFYNDGTTIDQVDDTKSQVSNANGTFVFTVDGGAYKGGTFDGTIAAGTSKTFYIDFGANLANDASVQGINDFSFDYTVAAIPEPATFGLIAVLGGGLLFVRRLTM